LIKDVVGYINKKEGIKICVGVPSGLNTDRGEVYGVAGRGDLIVSFGFDKRGYYKGNGSEVCRGIKIVDIGFPKFFYEK